MARSRVGVRFSGVACIIATGLLLFTVSRGIVGWIVNVRQPKLELVPGEADLGRIEVGQVGTTQIILKNAGYEQLLLLDVKSTCPCVVVRLGNRVLLPQDEEVLTVTFQPKSSGSKIAQVLIETNDPQHQWRVVRLKVQAVVP